MKTANPRPVSEQRRTVLIDRDFQLRFIGRLGGVLFFYLLLFLAIAIVAPVAFTFLGDPPEWALMETAFRVEVLLRLILAPLVCTFLCLFAHGVLETFRIAGPNFRFKSVMRDLARLRIPRGVTVRRSDLLQDTAAEFHQALVVLHDHVASLRLAAAEATSRAGEALESAPEAERVRAVAALRELEKQLGAFELVGCAPNCATIGGGSADAAPVEPIESTAGAR